jgi:hypothetical protein
MSREQAAPKRSASERAQWRRRCAPAPLCSFAGTGASPAPREAGINPMWMDYDDDDDDEEEKKKNDDKDDDDDNDDDDDDEDTLQTRPRAVILSAAKDLL